MRIVQLFIVFSFVLLLGACKKDDNRVCTQADFLGTFTGTTVCANGGVADATVTVSAGASETELSIDVEGSLFNVEINGCSFSGAQRDANVDLLYSGELNGNEIEVTLKGLVFMIPIDCTSTGKK